jgi:predicted nucleic acid-binding protein
MRITLDTNVLIAAFISRGFCAELFEHCSIHDTLVSSKFISSELFVIVSVETGGAAPA